MPEDANSNSPGEYQLVQPAEDFFNSQAEQEKLKFQKNQSLLSLFGPVLSKIYSNLLKFVESIIGIQLFANIDDFKTAGIPPKMKRLAVNFFQKKFIKQITRTVRFYPDEPWLEQYQVETPTVFPDISSFSDGLGSFINSGMGIDFDRDKAFIKTVGEGIERFCLCVYREKDCFFSSYSKVIKKALDPLSFVGIPPIRRQSDLRLKIDDKSVFRWVRGFSLYNNKKTLIPGQLIYIGYKYAEGEPIIREQISTGAAASDSFDGALYGGVCEAVERDALMIAYFNKLSPPLINPDIIQDEKFQKLLATFKHYNLELYIIDMTTDIVIPSILTVIIDRTGVGSVVQMGAKTSLDIRDAIRGAVCEALRMRLSSRQALPLSGNLKNKQRELKSNPSKIMTFEDRFLFWNSLDMLPQIEFLLRGPEKKFNGKDLNQYQDLSSKEKLKISLELLKKANIDTYGFDITLPRVKEEGVYVAKVISPQLQPLYLNEELRHSWGERLFNVPVELGYRAKPFSERELNSLPHPFL